MDITIHKTVSEVVRISEEETKRITKAYLRSLVAPGEYLRTNNGVVQVWMDDPHHRHGSIDEVYVRQATERDVAVFRALEVM